MYLTCKMVNKALLVVTLCLGDVISGEVIFISEYWKSIKLVYNVICFSYLFSLHILGKECITVVRVCQTWSVQSWMTLHINVCHSSRATKFIFKRFQQMSEMKKCDCEE